MCQMERDSKERNYPHLNVNGLLLAASETRKFNTLKEKVQRCKEIKSKTNVSNCNLAKDKP